MDIINHTQSIDGELWYRLLTCGFNNLNNNTEYLNYINVFPVSDGDTGTNMKRTFEMGINELAINSSFSDVFSSFIQGMLMGSRGNSGSILSQYFLGIYEHTRGKAEVNAVDFCKALKHAYKFAYQAVLHPVEGTILTVMRESAENIMTHVNTGTSLEQLFDAFTVVLFSCVQNTTERLSILRSNNVVDSGAAGLYLIFEGMRSGLCNDSLKTDNKELFFGKNIQVVKNPLSYRYCTEILLKIREDYSREYFIELLKDRGDSLIVTISNKMLKVHIHTNEPQNILDEFSKFGDFTETKIDDMMIQQEVNQYAPLSQKHNGYMIVSFVHGDGIIRLFDDLGCDIVFTATQNYHISDENFHFFVNKFIDKNIILLPNDENIYNTAVTLYPPDKYPNIHIINSTNIIKSYFLLSLMIGTDSIDKVLKTFHDEEKTDVFTAKILSVTIQQKKYFIGFTFNKTIIKNNLDDLLNVIACSEIMASYSTVIVFHGQAAKDEEIEKVSSCFENYDEMDFAIIDGKQDDFDYIIGAM